MRLAPVAALVVLTLSACGESDPTAGDAQPSTPTTSAAASVPETVGQSEDGTVTAPVEPVTGPSDLIVERRPMSDAERERLDRTEPPPLDCDDVGEAFWDYDGSVEPGTPGRTADDALVEVINDFNAEGRSDPRTTLDFDYVPLSGWIELTDGDLSAFVHTTGNWRFAVEISGDPSLANWRPQGALLCQPDDGGVPPRP